MRIGKLLQHVIVLAVLCVGCLVPATARQTGITGQYQAGCGGGVCHGGNANAATVLTLTGNTTVKTNTTTNYTFRVANGNQAAGGFNLAVLSGGTKAGTLAAGAGSQLLANEITHAGAQDFAGGGVDFAFTWTSPADHGTYTVAAAGNAVNGTGTGAGDIWNTFSTTITVQGAKLTAPVGAVAYCAGETINIAWTQTGIGNVKIELSKDEFANITTISNSIAASAGSFSYSIPSSTPTASTYVIRLVEISTGTELTRTVGFGISGAPVISVQPETQTLCEGRTLQLVAGATGKTPTYQWRKGGVNILGATQGVFSIPNCSVADAGTYDCIITSCTQSVTTSSAVVTVQKKPKITSQTTGNFSVCQGANVTLMVEATGDGIAYEWLRNGTILPGATSATLQLNNVTLAQEGDYRCRVSGPCSPADTSKVNKIDVLEPPSITGQPTNVTLKAGEKLTLTVGATGDSLRYQWFHKGVAIAGATAKTFTINSVVRADSGAYMCKVANKCDSVNSNQAKVTVNPATGPGKLALSKDTLNLSDIGQCEGADTLVVGLLKNEGGSPLEVTSVSTDPAAVLAIQGLTTPFTIQPGAAVNVKVLVTPTSAGPLNASATFFAASGNVKLTVMAAVTSDMQMDVDTLFFAEGVTGDKHCAISIALPCPSAVVNAITISGSGATSYTIETPPALPLTLTEGQMLELCVTTTAGSGSPAALEISSSAGTDRVALVRREVSSVEEATGIPGLTIAPNPMADHVTISLPTDASTTVAVYSVLGSLVNTLRGSGEIRWDGADANGSKLHSGLYILRIEQAGRTALEKVLVR
jgi:hypothetical protein